MDFKELKLFIGKTIKSFTSSEISYYRFDTKDNLLVITERNSITNELMSEICFKNFDWFEVIY